VLTNFVEERLEGSFSEEWISRTAHRVADLLTDHFERRSLSSFEDIDDVIAVIVDEAVVCNEKKCEEYPGGVDTAKDIERRHAPDPRSALA